MIDILMTVVENRYTRLVMVGMLFLGLQTTLLNDLRPFGVCLQVMLLLAVASGLAKGSETGAIAGFVVGLLYDMVLTTPLGLCAAVFAVVGYLAGFAHLFVHEATWWSRIIVGSGASLVGMILLPIAFTVTGTDGVLTLHVLVVALVVAAFNAIFTVPVELVCRWALREPKLVR